MVKGTKKKELAVLLASLMSYSASADSLLDDSKKPSEMIKGTQVFSVEDKYAPYSPSGIEHYFTLSPKKGDLEVTVELVNCGGVETPKTIYNKFDEGDEVLFDSRGIQHFSQERGQVYYKVCSHSIQEPQYY